MGLKKYIVSKRGERIVGNASGFTGFMKVLEGIVFWYPFIMSLVWIAGALIFVHDKEKEEELDIEGTEWPQISILLPCYNEEDTVEETIRHLSNLSYPNFEIIAVNDGSKDNTGKLLRELIHYYPRLRVIDCRENKGKANALHMAAHAAKSEYFVCVDSDAILDDMAPYHLVKHFLKNGERVGAVTGNPRIRNRDTLLGKIQLVEYASIIGLIKRTQRVYGKVMTVSGVIVAFRKKALMSVGLWDRDMITEDIAISWKLQKNFWDIRYEPKALCWMLVPETLSGIWNQRVRWSQGGQEVVFRHYDVFKDWRKRRLWPIYLEQVLSTMWSFLWAFLTIYIIFTAEKRGQIFMWFSFSSFGLAMVSFIQLFISMKHESTYDDIMKYYLWSAWYPSVYWMVNVSVVIAALPRAIKSSLKGGYAVWASPDRGQRKDGEDEEDTEQGIELEERSLEENLSRGIEERLEKSTDSNRVKRSNRDLTREEPAVENANKYIIRSNQSKLTKITQFAFSIIMWLYMFLVFFMFISAIFDQNTTFISLLKVSFKINNAEIRGAMFTTFLIFVVSVVIISIWKSYNIRKYSGLNRRKYPKKTMHEEMINLGLIDPEDYMILQSQDVIIFEKSPVKELKKKEK